MAGRAIGTTIEEVLPIAPLGIAREQQVLAAEGEQDDEALIVERLVGRLGLRGHHVRLGAVEHPHHPVVAIGFEGLVAIVVPLAAKGVRERFQLLRLIATFGHAREILLVLVRHLADQGVVDRRTEDLCGEPGRSETGRQRRHVTGLVVVMCRLAALEAAMQHVQRLLVRGDAREAKTAGDVLGHAQQLFGLGVRLGGQTRLELPAEMPGHRDQAGLKRDGLLIPWIFEPGHPHPLDLDLGEDVGAAAKTRNVIGVPVRHDHQREPVAAVLRHLGDGRAHAAEILGVDAAIDQDMADAGRGRHAEQEEIAEADAVHAHAQAAGQLRHSGGGRWRGLGRLRRPLADRSGTAGRLSVAVRAGRCRRRTAAGHVRLPRGAARNPAGNACLRHGWSAWRWLARSRHRSCARAPRAPAGRAWG